MSDYQTQMQHSRYDRTPVSILSDTITHIRYAGLPLIQPANIKRLILSTIILRMILILLRRNKVLIFYTDTTILDRPKTTLRLVSA